MTHVLAGATATILLTLAPGARAQELTVIQAEQAARTIQANYRNALHKARQDVAIAKERANIQQRIAKAEAHRLMAERELAAITPITPVATTPVEPSSPPKAGLAGAMTPVMTRSEPPASPPPPPKLMPDEGEQAADVAAAEKAARDFGGLSLGGGLSLTVDLGTRDRITEAEVVNGIVRVKNEDNTPARLLFESHYLFKPQRTLFGVDPDMWGVGPFVAIQPGDNQIINAIGLGLMIAFRREPTKTDSFNLGFGVIMDPNVQLLGDGLEANKPLPTGETAIRYREDSQIGLMAMVSFSF